MEHNCFLYENLSFKPSLFSNKELYLMEHTRQGKSFALNKLSTHLYLIHISEPTRLLSTSYAVFCLKKKKNVSRSHAHINHQQEPSERHI